ncbi:hypothetical protein K0M31_002006 [Melipona bicolor]|uniref:Uncharacterized protein n=1 Tax=Melipona bicolor TaxID=60889 RepID=A0AA40GHR0_9HYME|nr:hypothetical protein K0M31_002006 [Melipona bicolor]
MLFKIKMYLCKSVNIFFILRNQCEINKCINFRANVKFSHVIMSVKQNIAFNENEKKLKD